MRRVFRNSFPLAAIIMVALIGCTKDDADWYRTGVGLLKVNENEFSIDAVFASDNNSLYNGSSESGYGSYGSGYGSVYGSYEGSNGSSDYALRIMFYNEKMTSPIVIIRMTDFGLTSKTYTSGEGGVYSLGMVLKHGDFDFDDDSIAMTVNKSDNIYDITITGKTSLEKLNYTLTYKGTINFQAGM